MDQGIRSKEARVGVIVVRHHRSNNNVMTITAEAAVVVAVEEDVATETGTMEAVEVAGTMIDTNAVYHDRIGDMAWMVLLYCIFGADSEIAVH